MIQASRFAVLLLSVPAASVWRLPTCVKSGPTRPWASVPRIVSAERARLGLKQFFSLLLLGRNRLLRVPNLVSVPGLIIGGGLRHDRLAGLDTDPVHLVRYQIDLPV